MVAERERCLLESSATTDLDGIADDALGDEIFLGPLVELDLPGLIAERVAGIAVEAPGVDEATGEARRVVRGCRRDRSPRRSKRSSERGE